MRYISQVTDILLRCYLSVNATTTELPASTAGAATKLRSTGRILHSVEILSDTT
jgi:hypothetical protein